MAELFKPVELPVTITVELCGHVCVLDPSDPDFSTKLDALIMRIRAWALLRRTHPEEIDAALRRLSQP